MQTNGGPEDGIGSDPESKHKGPCPLAVQVNYYAQDPGSESSGTERVWVPLPPATDFCLWRYVHWLSPLGFTARPLLLSCVAKFGLQLPHAEIIICDSSAIEYQGWLRRVLEIARVNNLKMNKAKCQLQTMKIRSLGEKLTSNRILPNGPETHRLTIFCA